MKRFLVFAWEMTYEECGGWNDFHSAHDTFAEAELARNRAHSKYGGSHVVDLERQQIVASQYEENGPL